MSKWPRYPVLYEINTWVWLNQLRRKHQGMLDLGSVPAAEWDSVAQLGFDAVWLMGVWERSPAGIAIANRNPGLLEDFHRASPTFMRRTTSDLHIVCGGTWSINNWGGRGVWRGHERNCEDAGCA